MVSAGSLRGFLNILVSRIQRLKANFLPERKNVSEKHYCSFHRKPNLYISIEAPGYFVPTEKIVVFLLYFRDGEVREDREDRRGFLWSCVQVQKQRHGPDSCHQEVCGVR